MEKRCLLHMERQPNKTVLGFQKRFLDRLKFNMPRVRRTSDPSSPEEPEQPLDLTVKRKQATRTDPIHKKQKREDYTDEFVLQICGIEPSQEASRARYIKQHKSAYTHMLHFLKGKTDMFQVYAMLEILESEPQNIVGAALVSTMVFIFTTNKLLSIVEMFEFYKGLQNQVTLSDTTRAKSKHLFTKQMSDMVLHITLYKLASKRTDEEFSILLNFVPNIFINSMGKDNFFRMLHGNNGRYFLTEATKLFYKVITEAFVSTNQPLTEKWEMWHEVAITLVHVYMENTHDSQCDRSRMSCIFNMMLLQNLKQKLGTACYIHVETPEGDIKQLHLHQEVIERFGGDGSVPLKCPQVTASTEDIRTITSLLYLQNDEIKVVSKGKITIGVYNLATQLSIPSMEWFLFRGETCHTLCRETNNKVELLQILVKLKQDEMLEEFLKFYHIQFTLEEKLDTLLGMSVDQVQYFCSIESLQNLSELDKYFMLERWAIAQVGKDTGQEIQQIMSNDKHNSLILAKFNLVRNCLCLSKLARTSYGSFTKIKYINSSELVQSSRTRASNTLKRDILQTLQI